MRMKHFTWTVETCIAFEIKMKIGTRFSASLQNIWAIYTNEMMYNGERMGPSEKERIWIKNQVFNEFFKSYKTLAIPCDDMSPTHWRRSSYICVNINCITRPVGSAVFDKNEHPRMTSDLNLPIPAATRFKFESLESVVRILNFYLIIYCPFPSRYWSIIYVGKLFW